MRVCRGDSCAPVEGRPRRRLRSETSAGISDDEVLARTNAEGRALLTEDKDFGELAHPGREKCRLLATTRTAWPLLITTTMSPCPHISPQFPERRYYWFLTTVILFP
jgi:hypothetical protein